MYQVESHIAPPTLRRKKAVKAPRHYLFPFHEMRVGDSFEMPMQDIALCRSASAQYGLKLGMEFTIRIDSNTTYRCWRIK